MTVTTSIKTLAFASLLALAPAQMMAAQKVAPSLLATRHSFSMANLSWLRLPSCTTLVFLVPTGSIASRCARLLA